MPRANELEPQWSTVRRLLRTLRGVGDLRPFFNRHSTFVQNSKKWYTLLQYSYIYEHKFPVKVLCGRQYVFIYCLVVSLYFCLESRLLQESPPRRHKGRKWRKLLGEATKMFWIPWITLRFTKWKGRSPLNLYIRRLHLVYRSIFVSLIKIDAMPSGKV